MNWLSPAYLTKDSLLEHNEEQRNILGKRALLGIQWYRSCVKWKMFTILDIFFETIKQKQLF